MASLILKLKSGTFTSTGGWYLTGGVDTEVQKGTSVIKLTGILGVTIFEGNGDDYHAVWVNGSGLTATIVGISNSFDTLKFDANNTVLFSNKYTQTIGALDAVGTAGNIITLDAEVTAAGQIITVAINAGGSSYNVNDVINIDGGDQNAQLLITAVDGGGAVTGFDYINGSLGAGYSTGTGVTTQGGGGSGFTVNILSVGVNRWIISKSSGNVICNYLSIANSNATGGAQFFAGTNSTDGGNNLGWIFDVAPVDVNDSITVTESVTMRIQSSISTNDSITVSESSQILLPILVPQVGEDISVTESINTTELSYLNTQENILVAEFIANSEQSYIAVDDTIGVNESLSFTGNTNILIEDDVTVSEALNTSLLVTCFIIDIVNISESLSFEGQSFVSVLDNINVQESSEILIPVLGIDLSDTITVAEFNNGNIADEEVIFDSISLSEQVSVKVLIEVNIFESITVQDVFNEVIGTEVSVGHITLQNKQENRRVIKLYEKESLTNTNVLDYP